MKIKLFLSFGVMLSGLLVETTIAQTITAPTGQSLTITALPEPDRRIPDHRESPNNHHYYSR